MGKFSHSKIREWTYFFKKTGLLEKNNLTGQDVENEIKKCNYSLFEQPILSKLLRQAKKICSKKPDNLSFLRSVLNKYSHTTYSLEYSKEAIRSSLNKLSKKYSLIPLVYTTLTLPSYVNYASSVWREIFSINAFEKSDYGHLDFLRALLLLHKQGVLEIISIHFLNVNYDIITLKIEVNYKKNIKIDNINDDSLNKQKEENQLIINKNANVYISKERGIYIDNRRTYPIQSNSKRRKIINLLMGKATTLSGQQISKSTGQSLQIISSAIAQINKCFTTKLNLKDDLIIRMETGGYKLNYDRYNIEFIQNF